MRVCIIFGYSVNIIFVTVALLFFQRIFLLRVNTSYVRIRNEQASEQLIKVQFQVAMTGRYNHGIMKSLAHRRKLVVNISDMF